MVGGELGVGWQCVLCGRLFSSRLGIVEHLSGGSEHKKLINLLVVEGGAVGRWGEEFYVHRIKGFAPTLPRSSLVVKVLEDG